MTVAMSNPTAAMLDQVYFSNSLIYSLWYCFHDTVQFEPIQAPQKPAPLNLLPSVNRTVKRALQTDMATLQFT